MDDATLHPVEASQRQRLVMLRVVRMAFAIIILTVAILNAAQATVPAAIPWWVTVLTASIFIAAALVVDLLTPNKKISAISSVFLGILAGMLATVALGSIVDLLLKTSMEEPELAKLAPFMSTFKIMLGITLCYLGVTTVLQTQDDFRLVIPYVEFSKVMRGPKPLVLDTSSLIDARIFDVAQTGIIQTPVVIPRFVIAELQLLADSHDKLKRARGRRGLDVTRRLQRSGLDVSIDETVVPGKAVDQMLIELAKTMPGTIVTTDLGLARIAEIQGVPTLNLNDIANALKPALVPGETLIIRLIKPGEQQGQAVGYLDDGTMVVTEGSTHRIGEDATVMVTSTLQTSAGRLIFAKLNDEHIDDEARPHQVGDQSGHARDILSSAPSAPQLPANGPAISEPSGAPAPSVEPDDSAPAGPADASGSRLNKTGYPRDPFPPKPPVRRPTNARNPRR